MDEPLDSMGGPYKVQAAGRTIFTFAARDAPNELPLIRRNIWPFSESKELSHLCSANPPSFTNSDYLPKGISNEVDCQH